MYNVKIRILAQQDIQHTIDFYDKISSKVTDDFLNAFFSKLSIIKNNPHIFSVKYKNVRIAYLNTFPFGIHFLVIKKEIHIIAVLHTSRNPDVWIKR